MARILVILCVVGLPWCGADFCRREERHTMCPCGPIMCQQLCGRCYNVSSNYDVTKLECRCNQSSQLPDVADGGSGNTSQITMPLERQVQDNCPSPFKYDRAANFCYYLELRLEKSTDMAGAQLMCEKMAARSRLAVVNTHRKLRVIRTIVKKVNKNATLWIGAKRDDNGYLEKWSDGSPIQSTLWNPNEPDNYKYNEDCAALQEKWLKLGAVYGINDVPCTSHCNYICEVPVFRP